MADDQEDDGNKPGPAPVDKDGDRPTRARELTSHYVMAAPASLVAKRPPPSEEEDAEPPSPGIAISAAEAGEAGVVEKKKGNSLMAKMAAHALANGTQKSHKKEKDGRGRQKSVKLENGDELNLGVALNVLNISKRLKKVKDTKAVRRTEMKALDPQVISKNRVQREQRKRVAKSVEVLREVSTFKNFKEDQLMRVALSLVEVTFEPGERVIRQGDDGDEFFIIEKGVAIVSRKTDPDNIYEKDKELARLHEKAFFGEIALITTEKRSATVRASETGLKLLRMNKPTFQEIVAQEQKMVQKSRAIHGREIVASIPIFQGLKAEERDQMLESMTSMHYAPNTYICAQGDHGNTFHIIVEGICRVTIADPECPGSEREVANLHTDDYFGEVALLDESTKRTANVISETAVTTMSMTRSAFNHFLQSIRPMLMEHSALKLMLLNNSNQSAAERKASLKDKFRDLAILIVKNYKLDSFQRLVNEVLRSPTHMNKYGAACTAIFLSNRRQTPLKTLLHQQFVKVFDKPHFERTESDLSIVVGITQQNNQLKEKYCASMVQHQYADLCRHFQYKEYKADEVIYEHNARGSTAFIVLRGTVSLTKQVVSKDTGNKERVFIRHVSPGGCFGEASLAGMHMREYTARATSDVICVDFEQAEYQKIVDHGHSTISVDAKFQFLRKLSLFRNWELYRLYRLAFVMDQQVVNRGETILEQGTVSNALYFILRGSVNIQIQRKSSHDEGADHDKDIYGSGGGGGSGNPAKPETALGKLDCKSAMTLTTLQAAEYFGESGLLSFYHNSKGQFIEHAAAVANSHLDMFVLKAEQYKMLDRVSLEAISNNYKMRSSWRGHRLRDASNMQTHLGSSLAIMDWPKAQEEEGSALTRHIVKKRETWERHNKRDKERPASPERGHQTGTVAGGGVGGGMGPAAMNSSMLGGKGLATATLGYGSTLAGTIRPSSKAGFNRSVTSATRLQSSVGSARAMDRSHVPSSRLSRTHSSGASQICPPPSIAKTVEDFKHTLGPSGKLFTHTVRDPTYMERPNHWFYAGSKAKGVSSGSLVRPKTSGL